MKKIAHILIFVLSAALFTPLKAQTLTLSDKEQAEFKERIGEMLETFLNDLSSIGSKKRPLEFKKEVMKSTLRLFVNDGEPYTDSDGNRQDAPRMQTSSLRNGVEIKNRPTPIKTYLNNLMVIKYEEVTIKMAKTLHLSNLYKVGDHYEATATYYQYFRGVRGEGRLVYEDITQKTIRVVVQVEEVYGERIFVVRFGDIDVVQTNPA